MAEERLKEIRQIRLAKRQALLDQYIPPYPAEARRSASLAELEKKFYTLQSTQELVIATGRVISIRRHGGVAFVDVRDMSGQLQLQVTRGQLPEEQFVTLEHLDSGDFIQATGSMILTKREVKSVQVKEWHFLSKALRPLPVDWFGLKDHETRYRQRELDLLLNREVKTKAQQRSQIISWLRNYLVSQGFLEVETPMLQALAGGANAMPFSTHHQTLDIPLYLRIAPELYLKRLIVGGFEKVFEIGRNFRNEGIDRQHNPEFTSAELYWAYADYEDLMDFTEAMLTVLVQTMFEKTDIVWQEQEISFTRPWRRVRFIDLVSNYVGFDILAEKEPQAYQEVFKHKHLVLPEVQTYTGLLEGLYKAALRPSLLQPTLLYDYPIEMSPLAKQNLTNPHVAETFQLVVQGMELIKAYTELNDPVEQFRRFEEQQKALKAGDKEAHPIDTDFIRALEYGMPPTAGWGLGIDRLAMLLTNCRNIQDTILFPLLKPQS